MAQAEPFALHGCRRHFKGFPGTDFVRQQRVAAVEHMGNRVALMLPQTNIRVHADEMNVLPVILPRTGGIEQFIIPSGQGFPALRVFPYPIPESILNCLLFLLGKRSFLLVKDTALFTVRILHLVIDSHILQVQRILQNLIGIGTGGSVGHIAVHVAVAGRAFSFDAPFRRKFGKLYLNAPLQIKRRPEGLPHELIDIIRIDPCRTQTNVDLRSVQVFGLRLFQRLHIHLILRVALCHIRRRL